MLYNLSSLSLNLTLILPELRETWLKANQHSLKAENRTCFTGFFVLGTPACHTACHIELEYNEDLWNIYLDGISIVFDSYNYSAKTGCVSLYDAGARFLINCSNLGKGKFCKQSFRYDV